MNKKQFKDDQSNRIEIGERRTPKKKTVQQNPFARINLHPLEELEGRDFNDLQQSDFGNSDFETAIPENEKINSTSSTSSTSSNNLLLNPVTKQNLSTISEFTRQLAIQPPHFIQKEGSELEQLDVLVQPLSPVKDFQKVPNSVTREAMPAGLFRGKSKQVWDFLWSVSRGSIKPTRIVHKSRKDIMKGSGIGSMVTVDAALLHLELTGLLKKVSAIGSPIGNEYEIFTPEEIINLSQIDPFLGSTSSTSSTTQPVQKMVQLDVLVSGITSTTQVVENKDSYETPKTSLKTKRENDDDDDERFAPLRGLREIFDKIFKEICGKGIEKNDAEFFTEIAELLAAELREARSKTKSISKPAAFLARHLRNRLNSPAKHIKSTASKQNEVGKFVPSQQNKVDLSIYTAEEIEKLQIDFCLQCGSRHEECECTKQPENLSNG